MSLILYYKSILDNFSLKNMDYFLSKILEINYSQKYSISLSKRELDKLKILECDNIDERFEYFLSRAYDEREFIRLYSVANIEEREFLYKIINKKLKLGIRKSLLKKYGLDIAEIKFVNNEVNPESGGKYIIEDIIPNSKKCFIEINDNLAKIRDYSGKIIKNNNILNDLYNYLEYKIVLLGEIDSSNIIYLYDVIPYEDFYNGFSSCKLYSRKKILERIFRDLDSEYIKVKKYVSLEILYNFRNMQDLIIKDYYGKYE